MNIYLQELKFYRRSMLIWMVVFAVGVFGYLSLFKSFSGDVTASLKILDTLPAALRTALGIQLSTFFTIFGFFGYLLTYMWLVGAVQAMNLGIGILSKESSRKTADFLLSKPVTRLEVVSAKLLAALTVIALTSLVFIIAAYFSAQYFSTASFDAKTFILIALTMFFVQLFFLALGFLISTIVPKIKSVISYSLPIVFGLFIVGLLDIVIGAEGVRYLTPFKYFDPLYIIQHVNYDWKFIFVDLGVVLVCVVAGYVIFARKDIKAPA